jgi:hypothetical protein
VTAYDDIEEVEPRDWSSEASCRMVGVKWTDAARECLDEMVSEIEKLHAQLAEEKAGAQRAYDHDLHLIKTLRTENATMRDALALASEMDSAYSRAVQERTRLAEVQVNLERELAKSENERLKQREAPVPAIGTCDLYRHQCQHVQTTVCVNWAVLPGSPVKSDQRETGPVHSEHEACPVHDYKPPRVR